MTEATIALLKPYATALHNIRADNDKEFSYHERIAEELGVKVYFAHPYHSWERDKNTNGPLCQYRHKSTDFKKGNSGRG